MGSVTATYLIHDANGSFDKKAEAIALGLTVGTWTDLPELEQKQLEKHKGQVVGITSLPPDERANAFFGRSMHRALIQIRYPSANFTVDLPAIQATIFGKLSLDGAIKLVDFEWTDDVEAHFPGPVYGIEGIREQLGVFDRPLIMSIFKGMIGKPMDEFSEQLKQQALGGVDLVKDDEILFDNEFMPFMERIQKGKEILQQVYEQSGHRTLYAVHLSGRTFDLLEKAKRAVHAGANALLLNVFAYGIDVLQALAEHPDVRVPIFAHPAVSGATISSPYYGIASSVLLGKWLRLAGADAVLFPSPYGSVAMDRRETEQIAHALTSAPSDSRLKRAFPAPSAGIHPGLVPQLVDDFGRDSIINAGGGVHGHPGGAAAGGRAFRDAVDAAMLGVSLEQKASESADLRDALDLWGQK